MEDAKIESLLSQYESFDTRVVERFSDMPLSSKTLKGIEKLNIKIPTYIQKESIGHALKKKDILGSAITGSGKTLAFLIPTLEILYVNRWSNLDGVGAIVISPTRELAYQTFECLKKVGAFHDFSAGLIIGGKNLKFESKRMDKCNIVICTPGRLLQHMDENPLFNASSILILVLDEADRCLDMGFEKTINCIIENLPKKRQTLLFSATLTKSVKDLARLSLKDPIYVAPELQAITPRSLRHSYILANLEDKVSILWSFIRNHLKQKCIVFFSSCKQVKYIYEMFCKLKPGISILALYGTLHQDRRVSIYESFKRKNHVILFATDIASRGLDFPKVNWVVQLDCPEDVDQYIHRAGRSARNNLEGESLLVLTYNEQHVMLKKLKTKGIELKQLHIDPKKLFSPRGKMEGFLAQSKELKDSARRAFLSYIKSIYLMRNKDLFQIDKIDLPKFAKSLGLSVVPRVRFFKRLENKKTHQCSNESREEVIKNQHALELSKKVDQNDFMPEIMSDCSESEDNDDLLILKQCHYDTDSNSDILKESSLLARKTNKRIITKSALAKQLSKKKVQVNKKLNFNDDGSISFDSRSDMQSKVATQYFKNNDLNGRIHIEKIKQALREEDKFDKIRFGKIVKEKHKKIKNKLKNKQIEESISKNNTGIFNCVSSSRIYSEEDTDCTKNENVSENKCKLKTECVGEENTVSEKFKISSENLSLNEVEILAINMLSK